MRTAAIEGYRKPLVMRDLPEPPLPDHARVVVKANRICQSDWYTWVGDWIGLASSVFPQKS
jgi:D-arabinose 1-dehydrogenase-like Zn-dependent alcohol dehydrogenase